MALPFSRLFSVSCFEALRTLRIYQCAFSDVASSEVNRLIQTIEIGTLDYTAARDLDPSVPTTADPHLSDRFFRACIEASIKDNSLFVRAATLGRQKFIQKLSRDEAQCFRSAGLLADPITTEVRAWWDKLQAMTRTLMEAEKMARAREAEELSLQYETARLSELGIPRVPAWMSIEDNTVGYDILSYDIGNFGPINRLIEVKSTIATPHQFYLTRSEWETAQKFRPSYIFHIWDLTKKKLHEHSCDDVSIHVPTDNEQGRWTDAIIPIKSSIN